MQCICTDPLHSNDIATPIYIAVWNNACYITNYDNCTWPGLIVVIVSIINGCVKNIAFNIHERIFFVSTTIHMVERLLAATHVGDMLFAYFGCCIVLSILSVH